MQPRGLVFACALGLSSALCVATLSVGPERADAASSFSGYSQLDDASQTDVVGVASTRYDVKLILDTPTGCDQPYGTDVVYQTQWNVLNVDESSWLEIGTGHGCNGFMYWYGGYGASNIWHSLYTVNISGQFQQHQFLLRRGDDGRYYWYVSGTFKDCTLGLALSLTTIISKLAVSAFRTFYGSMAPVLESNRRFLPRLRLPPFQLPRCV